MLLLSGCMLQKSKDSAVREERLVEFPGKKSVLCETGMNGPFSARKILLKECDSAVKLAEMTCSNALCKTKHEMLASEYFRAYGLDVGEFSYEDIPDLEVLIESSSGQDKETYTQFKVNLELRQGLESKFAQGVVQEGVLTSSNPEYVQRLRPFLDKEKVASENTAREERERIANQPKVHRATASGRNHDGPFTGGPGGAQRKAEEELERRMMDTCFALGFNNRRLTTSNYSCSPARKESYFDGSGISYTFEVTCFASFICVNT